jgi:CHASE3 domain sensor protein
VTAIQYDTAAKRSHLRELGLPTLFGAAVLLVSATLLLGANVSALRGNLAWMDHSQQVLNQIDALETTILGDELSVRGYALTGDLRFRKFQQLERARSYNALAELQRLWKAEAYRNTAFRAVERDIERHLVTFGKLGEVRADSAQAVAHAIVDPDTRANMKRVRNGLAALRGAEMRDFAARQRVITNQLARAFLLSVGIILAAFLLGGIGVWAALINGPKR